MNTVIDLVNKLFWSYLLIYGLLALGLYFTVRLFFVQFTLFPEMLRNVIGRKGRDSAGITPFQALCTSLASRVGTGNIAGVAVALYLGGPGAIFWMWTVAALGMATAYAESTLAQLYKTRNEDGDYRGGPAFYMAHGLNAPWAGALFSVCLILAFGLVFNAVQANSIAESMEGAFGFSRLWVGIGLALGTGFVIFGGIRQVARVSEVVVPFMALAYLLVTLYVIAVHITEVPRVFGLIIGSAFGLDAAAGGVAGAMLNGVKRGLFSNEAGMGSAPNIAAVATPDPHHPSSQGLVQALGVFIDTLLICSATAFLVLLSGTLAPGSGLTGTPLTQAAMRVHIGAAGDDFVAVAIFFFAFTSIIGNYSYAENAMTFLHAGGRVGITLLRLAVLAMVVWGALESVTTVFNAADASMGLMATVNMIAILLLSGTVARLTRDYRRQRKAGIRPVFDMARFPELAGKVDDTIWSLPAEPSATQASSRP